MTDALAVFSALVAAGGLGFSGWQLRLLHVDRKAERDLEIAGVCLSWRAASAPHQADVDKDGNAVWQYVFAVTNPGRFPISNVTARVTFPDPVSRLRHNGLVDPAVRTLELAHPVLAGGSSFEWAPRTLRTKFDPSPSRGDMVSEVTFTDAEGGTHATSWPARGRSS